MVQPGPLFGERRLGASPRLSLDPTEDVQQSVDFFIRFVLRDWLCFARMALLSVLFREAPYHERSALTFAICFAHGSVGVDNGCAFADGLGPT